VADELSFGRKNIEHYYETFDRKTYNLLGLLVDFIGNDEIIDFIEQTCSSEQSYPKYIATINLYYICRALKNRVFRNAVLDAGLCFPDGMPLIWIGKFLNICHKGRVTGADLLPELIKRKLSREYNIFIFGTTPESAKVAQKVINENSKSLKAVGFLSPEIAPVEELSKEEYIKKINDSKADILFISLDSEKAMEWISRNRGKIKVKFMCVVGAAIDFLSGKKRRAPRWMQEGGLEWLYRLGQEPLRLWKRYLNDGILFIGLFFRYLLPYKIFLIKNIPELSRDKEIRFDKDESGHKVKARISGTMNEFNYSKSKDFFRDLLKSGKHVEIDLSSLRMIDNSSLGLLKMFSIALKRNNKTLSFAAISKNVMKAMRYNLFAIDQ